MTRKSDRDANSLTTNAREDENSKGWAWLFLYTGDVFKFRRSGLYKEITTAYLK